MNEGYRAIFFDWDGTAVTSRKAPVDEIVSRMKGLLNKGIKLAIISGTTIENIAGGRLQDYFTEKELENLFLGLGRGAYNYKFNKNKNLELFNSMIPEKSVLLDVHKACFDIHMKLLEDYDYKTDIVFSRPNYCKIDLMVDNNRGEQLFLQENEVDILKENLTRHGFNEGILELIKISEEIGKKYGLDLVVTTDAKYLEVGVSSKSDNVNTILRYFKDEFGILPEECSFWGDEYIGIDEGLYGSDSFMITDSSKNGDFFDVSNLKGKRPEEVIILSGGVERFLEFLSSQENL
ncbi:HAD hydrolase family protein [Clostridium perfringens]|uniref:HAD hydrolase family protein n=1 Tax=Clostridium perfringens TaxID=1502 RepID=UPI002913BC02|nr:HAD hydrolase family protein [Clostridium perfringens]EJT6170901.1 HAD hydrolase family protein [Clostridium perfringens]EJT6541626.1 HAD hydrolase family protein [Clostridium perfringens]EJT6566633.1 HAD hydrolase family protein [Clostridium perfringens]MBS5994632.1 HAD hydrolase family protein [Clostridium perfringens]MDM0997718.1 HAD hydrolase family protein [Clostridium perfringens]